MKNSSRRRSKGTGKSILSFFFGMIMGVVLFVGAIAGTLYALVATVRVGDVTDMAGLEDGTIFDADSEINDKTLLEIYKMLAGEDFSNMTLNEIAEKYGLTGKLALAENEDAFIDVSVLFDVPLNEIGNQWAELILDQITLNKIGGLTNLQFDEYGLPILDDNLNVPIIDAIDHMLSALSGEITLRQIEDNFGITLGDNGIFTLIKDTPVSQLSEVIDGLRVGALIDADTDKFVAVGSNEVYVKTGRYEVVDQEDYLFVSEGATTYVCGIEDGMLLERELRFVQKTTIDEDGNEVAVLNEDGNPVYRVDNSCYDADATTNGKTYYRYYEYELYDADLMPVSGEFYIKTCGNCFEDNGFGYELVDTGYVALHDLATNESGSIFTTTGNLVTISKDVYIAQDGAYILADKYGVDPFIHAIDNTTRLQKDFDGYARVHVGSADSAIQAISYITVGGIDNATEELQGVKLGDLVEVTEDSAHILKVMQDRTLNELSFSIEDLLLSEVIEITPSLYTEDPNGKYIFVTLPTDKYVVYDEALHGDKDKYVLRYTEDEDGKYVLFNGSYFYYDEDDTTLSGLTRYSAGYYLADGTEGANTTYYAHSEGGYYTLYHPDYGTSVKRYTKQTTGIANFSDYIVATDFEISTVAITKYYFDGTKMVEGMVDGKTIYVAGNASNRVIQRLASTTIGDLADAFDTLILGDVIEIDPDVYALAENTNDTNQTYFYEVDGLFYEASRTFIEANGDLNFYTITKEGTSHVVLKKMAYMPVLEIGNNMEKVINDLYLEDLIDIYENNIVEENVDEYGLPGEYFTPYDKDYDKYVGEDVYHYTFVPNVDGKYYLRDYDYVALTDEQVKTFENGGTTVFSYKPIDTSAIQDINLLYNGNAYFKDEQGNYHNNPALCLYIVSTYLQNGDTTGLDSVFVRVGGEDYTMPTYTNPTYNGAPMLYVNILGEYTPYDASRAEHADLQKYLLVKDGYSIVESNVADDRTYYYLNKSTNTFSTDSTGAYDLTFVKHSSKGTVDGVDMFYYVTLDGEYNKDFNNGIFHVTYSKELAETVYVRTNENDATHVFADGKLYALADMPDDLNDVVYVKGKIGSIISIKENITNVLDLLHPETIKIDYIQKESVSALKAFAEHDVKVGGLNTALDEFTVEDLITVAPDSMFDDEEIKDAKLTDLSTVFQNKIKYMTIQNIIDWGNISTLNPTVLSIIGEATLEDFFASLSYEDGKINVDIVILYVNIYARQNETV